MKKIKLFFAFLISYIANFIKLPSFAHADKYDALRMYDNQLDMATNLDLENLSKRRIVLANIQTNFTKQFDLLISRKWYTPVSPAPPEPTTDFPVFLFAPADHQSNYSEALKLFQVPAGFNYVGRLVTPDPYWSTIIPTLLNEANGSVILVYNQTGTLNWLYIVISCNDVGYALMLNGILSSKFDIKKLRYSLPSTTLLTQYDNIVTIFKNSMYGRGDKQTFSPLSFKNPNQMQPNIIDIDLIIPIDKETGLATLVKPAQTFTWSVFLSRSGQ
jgi:hypothetical protein